MGAPTARLTDMWAGVCVCHCPICVIGMAGIIVSSSPNVDTNTLGNARCGDLAIGFCGHSGVVSSCSSVVLTNEIGQARLGDTVIGCINGVIVTGSPNVDNT